MDVAYPDYTDLPSGVFDIVPAPAYPLSMATTQPLPETSFYTFTPSYANEQQSYDLTTSISYCPELDLEGPVLEDYLNVLSQYEMTTANTVESSALRSLEHTQPYYSGWDSSN